MPGGIVDGESGTTIEVVGRDIISGGAWEHKDWMEASMGSVGGGRVRKTCG